MNSIEEMVMVSQANMFFIARMFVGSFQGLPRAQFDEAVRGMIDGYRQQSLAWIDARAAAMVAGKTKERDVRAFKLQSKQALDAVTVQLEGTLQGLSVGILVEPPEKKPEAECTTSISSKSEADGSPSKSSEEPKPIP